MIDDFPKPKKPKPKGKGIPPSIENTIRNDNTSKEEAGKLVPINFKVSQEFKTDLKTFAAINEKSMVSVLIDAFEFYKKSKDG